MPVRSTGGRLVTFTVKRTMSVVEISKAIYKGDATKAVEIMRLNALDDPFSVSGGTIVRYYQAA